jgi:glycine/D-amino acid oxidase-like deaminating enzyme
MPAPRVAVIGAGAFGGWTALHLRNLGADVVLLDAAGPGNALSSSGGETRIIRAVYGADRIYSEMVRRSFPQWKALDPSLYVPTGMLWMYRGDDAYVRAAAPILHDLGLPLDQLAIGDAARLYPQIDFRGVTSVWLEERAGGLFSRRACRAVCDAFVRAGGRYRTASVTPAAIARVEADIYVFACGPWLRELFPDVAVRPTRQEVYYFEAPERFRAGRLPMWMDFGERVVYGMPAIGGGGFKFADDTRGETIDPSTMTRTPTPEGIERARMFLAERFPELASARLLSSEVCQYENSPDGNFLVDRHPTLPEIWIAGGGSGHGFKMGPAFGEMLARLVRDDGSPDPLFRLARLASAAR